MTTKMANIMFLFVDFGFLWLYFLTFHRPNWFCNRIRDIERVIMIIMMDSICIFIVAVVFPAFELTLKSLSPTVTYLLAKLYSYLLKKIHNEITHLSNLFEKIVIDRLITTLDDILFYPMDKIYMKWIKPDVMILTLKFTPMFEWIEAKKKWIENRILFIKYLKEFNKKIWEW